MMSHNETAATIQALENWGSTAPECKFLRAKPGLAQKIADRLWKEMYGTTEVDEQLLAFLHPSRFFGPADWKRYYNIDFVPDLPIPILALRKILESDCPFVKGKKVKDTHYLYCLPKEIGGGPITALIWDKIYLGEEEISFKHHEGSQYKNVEKDVTRYQWFLMFEGIIPNTVEKSWQQQLKEKPEEYEVPKVVESVPLPILIFKKNNGLVVQYDDLDRSWRTIDQVDGIHVNVVYRPNELSIYKPGDDGVFPYTGLYLFRKLY